MESWIEYAPNLEFLLEDEVLRIRKVDGAVLRMTLEDREIEKNPQVLRRVVRMLDEYYCLDLLIVALGKVGSRWADILMYWLVMAYD